MPNEPRGGHGERIATLESGYEHLVNRINHLDDCVDGVKVQAEKNAAKVDKNHQLWDRRWVAGLAIIGTLIFVSGSGFISLKELVAVIVKLIR